MSRKPLVILVHGIRTFALWYAEDRAELERAGFAVELTNYGRFGLLLFLLPLPFVRTMVIKRIAKQITRAAKLHRDARVSFIAHSFGTYVLAKIIQKKAVEFPFEFRRLHRVIFCGSVLPYNFDFGEFSDTRVILSEVGRKDYWPAVAKNVTWGYGDAGTNGFRRPGVRDRYHNDLGHSDFLTKEFCKEYWVPYLRSGTIIPGDEKLTPQSLLVSIILFFVNKYFMIALIVLYLIWALFIRWPISGIDIQSNGTYAFVGSAIHNQVQQIEQNADCYECRLIEIIRRRRCVTIDYLNSDAHNLVTCAIPEPFRVLESRDPLTTLEGIAERVPCLRIDGIERRRVKVDIDRAQVTEWHDAARGKTWMLCGCNEAAVEVFKKDRLR